MLIIQWKNLDKISSILFLIWDVEELLFSKMMSKNLNEYLFLLDVFFMLG